MLIAETPRLRIRHLKVEDAEFIVNLLNEDTFIKNIGDKGVRTIQDAVEHLQNGPINSYQKLGFGLNLVKLKSTNQPIGMCGILKREQLVLPDLGYAFLAAQGSQGYAKEASLAVLKNAHEELGLSKLLAVTKTDNVRSIKLLEKLGFKFQKMITLYENQPDDRLFEFQF